MAKYVATANGSIRMVKFKQWLRKLYALYVKHDQKEVMYYKYLEQGGETLRLDYALGEDSFVIDVGGYIGDFAADISNEFHCYVDVFEPVAAYAEKIKERFKSNDKVNIIQAGLGSSNREEVITLEGLGSSVFVDGREEKDREKIKIISLVDYIKSKGYSKIDLIKINIEGGEFELLEGLLAHSGWVEKVKYFQIQFHDFVPDAEKKMMRIQELLSKTHRKMWCFPFIWESWKIK